MKQQQAGFTLIELVVVIVILGILAATALPRFAGFQKDAQLSAVKGMEAAVQGASALAHATALVQSQTGATGAISMEGQNVSLAYGYPVSTTGGIDNALASYTGFTYTSAAGTFALNNSSGTAIANCLVTYTAATSATAPATVATTTTGC